MNKKKKKIIIIVSIVVVILIIIGVIAWFLLKKDETNEMPVNTIEVLDSINGYDYKLEDRDTELYKEKFLELKSVLESDVIDYESYAKLLAELYVIDLYTIDNKVSKYDVGSLEFIYPEDQEEFKNKVIDTIYKLVEDNATNKRKQELPEVMKTEVKELENTTYQKNDTTLTGYKIPITLTYTKDLEYDKNVIVTVVKENDKMYVVSLTPQMEE